METVTPTRFKIPSQHFRNSLLSLLQSKLGMFEKKNLLTGPSSKAISQEKKTIQSTKTDDNLKSPILLFCKEILWPTLIMSIPL